MQELHNRPMIKLVSVSLDRGDDEHAISIGVTNSYDAKELRLIKDAVPSMRLRVERPDGKVQYFHEQMINNVTVDPCEL